MATLWNFLSGATGIVDAAREGDLERAAEIVRRHPGCTNEVDDHERTPLYYAAIWEHVAMMRLLFNNGAVIDWRFQDGDTALHWACGGGNDESVRFLLDHGAFINRKSELGNTPLHWASKNTRLSTITLLLDRGADAEVPNMLGKTPCDVAATGVRLTAKREVVVQLIMKVNSVDSNEFIVDGFVCANVVLTSQYIRWRRRRLGVWLSSEFSDKRNIVFKLPSDVSRLLVSFL